MFRNEMSTILPLLDYRDISKKLERYDGDKPRARVTHVAVLNHRLEEHPQGALCLLLRKEPEVEACIRLRAFPVAVPHLGDLVSRLKNTKLLICPSLSTPESNNRISTIFSVKSDFFRVETWNAKGSREDSILSARTEQNSRFEIRQESSRIIKAQS